MITHSPPPHPDAAGPTVAAAEALLSNWFEAPVVLTSSGRAALRLAFADLGLNRYRDTVAMSPKTAACVLEAVIGHAFPQDIARDASASATLLIHQYGFVQQWTPTGPVVEDICHAFFATPKSGARIWRGDYRVFSLPKFLSCAGMVGGVITRTDAMADRLRERVKEAAGAEDSMPANPSAAFDRAVFRGEVSGRGLLEQLYVRKLLDPTVDTGALAGLSNITALQSIGEKRRQVAECILGAMGQAGVPDDWRTDLIRALPFSLPMFGDVDHLNNVDAMLAEAGIAAGVYDIDQNRDARRPKWMRALLIPCHHMMGDDALSAIVDAVAK